MQDLLDAQCVATAKQRMKQGYSEVIQALNDLGYDVNNDENYADTPERAAKAMIEDFVLPKKEIERRLKSICSKVFTGKNDEMIIQTAIPVISLCPHHLQPVAMKVWIGYIPKDKVLGLSKLTRIAQLLGKKPLLQETYTVDVAEAIIKYLKPIGVAVYVEGVHGCMKFRGVRVSDETKTITSSMRGAFRKNLSTRTEFLSIIRG